MNRPGGRDVPAMSPVVTDAVDSIDATGRVMTVATRALSVAQTTHLDRSWLTPSGPAVYRLFNLNDRVIYIGSTTSVHQRIGTHMTTAWWWAQVVRAEVQQYPSLPAARDAESEAIRTEHPLWNTFGIPELVKVRRKRIGMAPRDQEVARIRRLHPERFCNSA